MDHLGKRIVVFTGICIVLVSNIHQAAGVDAVPAKCLLPKSPGNCQERHFRYYFDHQSHSCVMFYYTGCGGNENIFESITVCLQTCRPTTVRETTVTTSTQAPTNSPTTEQETTRTTTTPAATDLPTTLLSAHPVFDHGDHYAQLDRLYDQIQQKYEEHSKKVEEYHRIHDAWVRENKPLYKYAASFDLKDVNETRKLINFKDTIGRYISLKLNVTGK